MKTFKHSKRPLHLLLIAVGTLLLLSVLASCSSVPSSQSDDCAGLECRLQAVTDEAGFSVLVPDAIPAYFVFEEVRYDPDTGSVTFSYVHRDGSMERLMLSQRPVDSDGPFDLAEFYPPDAIEQIQVDTSLAHFVQGVYLGEDFDPSVSNQQFVWSADGMEFWISATLPSDTARSILVRIADSIDG